MGRTSGYFVSDVRRSTYSERTTFKDCRRKWYFGHYRKLALIREDVATAATLGTRVHEPLGIYYDPADTRDPMAVFEERAAADVVLDLAPDKLKKVESEIVLARLMVEGYFEWLAETGADEDLEIIAAEEKVEATLGVIRGRVVTLLSKQDARANRRSDGARVFMDHKTVQSFEERVNLLHLDEQVKSYMLVEYLIHSSHGEVTDDTSSGAGASEQGGSGNVPGAQSSASVGVPLLRKPDSDFVRSSRGRESSEQRSGESGIGAQGMPLEASQRGRDENVLSGAPSEVVVGSEGQAGASSVGRDEGEDRGSEPRTEEERRDARSDFKKSSRESGVTFVDGAIYNMLRKVKRSATAKPPFYAREEQHHNLNVLRSYWSQVWGEMDQILAVEQALDAGADHHVVAPPSPSRDCSWKCPFLPVCPMVDDSSMAAERVIHSYYVEGDPLARYAPTAE